MRHRLDILLLTLVFATPAAAASTARLIAPGDLCVGVEGPVAEGAAVRLESCDGLEDQLWDFQPRGFLGQIRLQGLCLEGGAMRLADCRTGGNFALWRHDTDGRLSTGLGQAACLDSAGGLSLAACGEAESQRFFAEGHQAWTPRPAGGPVQFLPIQTGDPEIWYGRDAFSLLRSENGGRSFVHVRGDNASNAFTVSPYFDYHTLWSMEFSGVVSRSRDDGRTWTPVLDMPQPEAGAQRQIFVSQIDPQRIYAFGSRALWASHDRGETFTKRGALPDGRTGDRRLLDLGGGALLYLYLDLCLNACPAENVNLWRSGDDGASWQPVLSAEGAYKSVTLLDDSREPNTVYLTLRPPGQEFDLVWRSVNDGRSFTLLTALPGRDGQLFADRHLPSTYYYLTEDSLYRSDSGVTTWFFQALPLESLPVHDRQLSVLGLGRLRLSALLDDGGFLKVIYFDSDDGGATYSGSQPGFQALANTDPLPALVTGRQGRVYYRDGPFLERTDDGGRSWQRLAKLREAVELAADPHESAVVFARFASGELHRSSDAGLTFSPLSPPASVDAFAVFPRGDQTVVLAASQPGFYRSLDQGSSWSPLPSPRPEQRFAKLAADGGTVYGVTETGELYASLDAGSTFVRRGIAGRRLAAGAGLLAYRVEELDPDPRIRVSTDGGATFVDRYPPEEKGTLGGVFIDAGGTFYVAGATTVLRSRDLGVTWQSLGRDLIAGAQGGALVSVDPFDPAKLYHSSNLGLRLGRWDQGIPLDLGSRFEARLFWRNSLGLGGDGMPVALTRDSGLFWLFTPDRAEVSVKLLDGRAINGRWWVFVASMTDVELFLTVTDRATGFFSHYHHPLGQPMSFGDIEAFPGSPADPAIPASPPPGGQLLGASSPVLIDDRFEVSVEWSQDGFGGSGLGKQINRDSAAFYFFDPANVEVVVNLIDGRPVNGKRWVYFGSMSNVEFTLRVKDLESGQTRTYFNPAGTFASVGDTQAFD